MIKLLAITGFFVFFSEVKKPNSLKKFIIQFIQRTKHDGLCYINAS